MKQKKTYFAHTKSGKTASTWPKSKQIKKPSKKYKQLIKRLIDKADRLYQIKYIKEKVKRIL